MREFKSVTELNNYVKNLFLIDSNLSCFELTAEISGFKLYPSGHCYFSLKDTDSVVPCVMFRNQASTLDFRPEDGMKVVVYGNCDLYSANGKYQIRVTSMKKVGKGDLKAQFEELLKKLNNEGLFDNAHKVDVPLLPKRIGVLSSPKGAVIHDMLVRLKERNPHFDLVLYPAAVQGAECPVEMIAGIDFFEKNNLVDVIIIARGGGSLEDLWGFNDERLARRIYSCKIPIISAVGHEVDYSISDYVADLRAPTPTAAAELVIGRYVDLKNNIDNNTLQLNIAITNLMEARRRQLDGLRNHKALHSPAFYATNQKQVVKNQVAQLNNSMNLILKTRRFELGNMIDRLDSLNPLNVLKRGYSYINDENNNAIESVKNVKIGQKIGISLADGKMLAEVTEIKGE